MDSSGQSQERIPVTLQNVFLASNRGKEVHKPPPGNIASRTFSRLLSFRKKKKSVDDSLHSVSSRRQQKKGFKQNHQKEGGADIKLSTKESQVRYASHGVRVCCILQPVSDNSSCCICCPCLHAAVLLDSHFTTGSSRQHASFTWVLYTTLQDTAVGIPQQANGASASLSSLASS